MPTHRKNFRFKRRGFALIWATPVRRWFVWLRYRVDGQHGDRRPWWGTTVGLGPLRLSWVTVERAAHA